MTWYMKRTLVEAHRYYPVDSTRPLCIDADERFRITDWLHKRGLSVVASEGQLVAETADGPTPILKGQYVVWNPDDPRRVSVLSPRDFNDQYKEL